MRQSAVKVFILGVAILGLQGCVQSRQQAVVIPDADRAAERQQYQQRQKVARLLELAEHALANDRLMRPKEDNAFDWYQSVLHIDELNADAHQGMKLITRRYLQLAEEAFAVARPSRAEQMLRGALQVAASPTEVEAIRAQYREQVHDKVFALSPQDLRARNDQLQQRLIDIARRAREQQSRLLIVARSDAEGRWIYKQMRTAVEGYRLRGNIEVGDSPRILLIDL